MKTTTGYEGQAMRIVQVLQEYSRPLPVAFLAKLIGLSEEEVQREVKELCSLDIAEYGPEGVWLKK
jgi:DNA-binding Lrp family transcriptional regulator